MTGKTFLNIRRLLFTPLYSLQTVSGNGNAGNAFTRGIKIAACVYVGAALTSQARVHGVLDCWMRSESALGNTHITAAAPRQQHMRKARF